MRLKKIYNLLALIFLFLSFIGKAGIHPAHQRLQDSISTSGKDTVWVDLNPKTGSFRDVTINDIVTVGIDADYPLYANDSSVFRIYTTIKGYDAGGTLITNTTHTFTVTHDLFGKKSMRDMDIFIFNNAYKYKVTFTGGTKNGVAITSLPDYIYFDADIEIERYYAFATYASTAVGGLGYDTLDIDCDMNAVQDELRAYWSSSFGSGAVNPEYFDLEWTFINDYDSVAGLYKNPSTLIYDFRGNSTRISTKGADNSYKISLIYEHGFLLFRVRAIGVDTANPDNPIVGVWSLADSGTVSSVSSAVKYHITRPHDDAMMWQYSSSFAEDGKKKEVVNYFDGSQRNRQTVTKVNSDKNTIVGETIYDYQGRPAVKVMAVPVDGPTCTDSSESVIMFYPNFNRDTTGTTYSRADFDLADTTAPCNSGAAAMGTSWGASHYYSPNNPNKTAQQAFVPDAKKYPFSQVEYTPDNTGRVRRQGGVGAYHQLNSGHETKYYYGQPTQTQLDRMFGSEAGDAAHYKKNIVIDANGQVTVTYLNMEGKTIATALAGDSANGLINLPSNQSSVYLTTDLFNKDANGNSQLNTLSTAGNSIEFNSQLLATYPSWYHFDYTLAIDTMADSCLRNNVCFSCVYDLEMHVYDECGNDILAALHGDTVQKKTIGHFSLDSLNNLVFDTICTTPTTLNEADTFSLFLPTGNYTVSKILTVNPLAISYYVSKYLDTLDNGCYKSLNSFVQAALDNVDTSGCHITCASCLTALGDRDDFVANGKGSYMDYDALADACQEPCRASSQCYIRYLQMVSDMALGGQYGEYLDNSNNQNPGAFPLSVYNTSNSLCANNGGTGNWQHPYTILNNNTYTYYVDDNGHASKIALTYLGGGVFSPPVTSTTAVTYDSGTGTFFTDPSNLANFSDFVANWQPSWAKSLVKYHPEYCYYETCQGFGQQATGDHTTSDAFDALLMTTNTYSAAVAAGLINAHTYSVVSTTAPYDPFITNYGSYGTNLNNQLFTNAFQPLSGYTLTMQQVSAFIIRCGNLYGNHDTTNCTDFGVGAVPDSIKNKEWNTFKSYYLSAKQILQQQYMDDIVKGGSCPGYSGCFGDSSLSFNGYLYSWAYSNSLQPCNPATAYLYSGKIRRFASVSSVLPSDPTQAAYQFYLQTGQCPMAFDLQSFLAQVAQTGKLKTATHTLLDNYSSYTHDMYALLGGATSSHTPYYWNSSTTGATISADFKDSTGAVKCSLTIDASISVASLGVYKILNVTGLADSTWATNPNEFRLYLVLQDTVTDSVYIKKALGYSTCFQVGDCKFTQTCTPNDFASDLQKLMTALAFHHKLGSNYVSLDQTLYYPYITPYIKNQIGTTTSNKLIWNYDNADGIFELYDSLRPAIRLAVYLGGDTATIKAAHPGLIFANIYGFNNINSHYFNIYTISALDSLMTGGQVNLSGVVDKIDTAHGDTILGTISMGSCGYPTAFACEGTPYTLQNDLQLLIHDALVSMPGSHNVDLVKLPSYSSALAGAFPLGLDTTSSVIVTHTSGWGNYKTQLLFTVKSASDSCYFSLNADTLHAFDSIIDFYSLQGYGPTDSQGNYHQFKGVVKYQLHSGTFIDTLYGQSCLPIQNCCACATADTISTTNSYIPVDTCLTAYNQYLAGIAAFNSSPFAVAHHYSIDPGLISYYDVTYFGYCNCISGYITYLNTWTDTVQRPLTILDINYTGCPNAMYSTSAGKVCEVNYRKYIDAVSAFNSAMAGTFTISTSAYTMFSFNALGFCDCWPAYKAFLTSIEDGSIPPALVDTSKLNIANFCETNSHVPCQVYVAPDTGTVGGVPPTIGYTPPPDSSCAQYAINLAIQNGTNAYNQYRDSLTTVIAAKYLNHCLGADENFTDTYQDKEYHQMLYYYDQAGNLVRTIPPEGVHLVNITGPPNTPITTRTNAVDSICWDRTYNQHAFMTNHTMPTTYLFNSLNQLVKQSMPDHDPVDIWDYTLPNGLNTSLKITGVQFINENQGYLTGYMTLADTIVPKISRRGYMYSTTNGGKNWQPMTELVASDLNKVQMVTNYTGYAVGKNGILLKTSDGAYSWDIVPTFAEFTGGWAMAPEWKDLYFNDSIRGIVTGTNGKSLIIDFSQSNPANYIKTVSLDGGATDILTGVTYDGSFAYASSTAPDGHGYLYKSTVNPFTTDSLRWSLVTGITASNLLGAQFTTANTSKGFISGVSGTLLRTTDAGSHWESVNTGVSTDIQGIFFRNDSVGVAMIDSVSGYPQLFRTSTGGRSWTQVSTPGQYVKGISSYVSSNTNSSDRAYVVGKSGLVARLIGNTNNVPSTVYNGQSPFFGMSTINAPNVHTDYNAVAVATYTVSSTAKPKVIMGAANGKVYFSNKADSTTVPWDSLNIGKPIKKIAIKLYGTGDSIQAVAIDTSGVLYGINAVSHDTSMITFSGTTPKFIDVAYNGSANAFYAFDNVNHKVYKLTFSVAAHPHLLPTFINSNSSITNAKAIAFTGGNSLIVTGDNGDIYKDSTVTAATPVWVNASGSLKFLPLNDVQSDGTGSPVLYAVGRNGTMIRKAFAGAWTMKPTAVNLNLNSIKFKTSSLGMLVTDGGQMYAVNVSGTNVTLNKCNVPGGLTQNLHDLVLTSNTVTAVGDNGVVLTIPNITATQPLTATQFSMGVLNMHNFYGASVWPGNQVLMVGDGNSIYNLSSYIMRVSAIYTQELYKAHFNTVMNGYVVGENGFMRHTSDGISWQPVLPDLTPPTLDSVTNVLTYQPDKAAIVGKNGYMAKITGASTPVQVTLTGTVTGTPDLNDIAMGQNTTTFGYVVGDSKTAFKFTIPGFAITSINPGSLPLPSTYDLHALHVFLDNSVMAVGSKGAALFYNAGSNTWHRHAPPNPPASTDSTKYNFNDVFFHDDRNGYAVGDKGVVLRWFSSNNIQNINTNTFASGTYFVPKPTRDTWASDSTKFNVTCLGFPTRNDGFLGGMYPDSVTNAKYARLIHDESQQYSTFFWYDALGRMVLSQNSKQFAKSPKAYSYTLYDVLGRVVEAGEKAENTTGTLRFPSIFGTSVNHIAYNVINNTAYIAWLDSTGRTEVTHTYYDSTAIDSVPLVQANLRKRVSAITYEDVYDNNVQTYQHGTFYSYDIHGNVNTLIQDNQALRSIKQRYKRIDYDYDLISGKVNDVYYERDSIDAFAHHYEYDADNRITEVYTSHYPRATWTGVQGNTLWDNDAKYFYYAHGPVARVEYGNNSVQGQDYYYTLQGWIKGVNSNILNPANDGGQDGYNVTGNGNKNFARDAYGYTLGYFAGDYSPIDTSKWNTVTKRFEAKTTGSSLAAARYDLFNGNLSHMVTTLVEPDTNYANQTILPQGAAYKYDQLNRLMEMQAFINITNNAFGTTTYDGRYNSRYTYDENGNILSQVRKKQNGATFDSLTYRYNKDSQGNKTQNRLYHVNDTIAANVMSDDIDNEGTFNPSVTTINTANNYSYDKVGDLVRDSAAGIATIGWTVSGKIKSITHRPGYYKLSGTDTIRPPDMVFNYDGANNRISKVVKPRTATTVLGDTAWVTTHYVRDAQGNVLSIYRQRDSAAITTAYFTQIETHLYGSSKLGVNNTSTELLGASFNADTTSHYAGNKSFELTNHLSNVLSTVSDKRIPLDTNANDTIDYYVANIISATDYAAFGSPMDGRNWNSSASRYGFNGKEKDDETYGQGNEYDYGARIFDPRLGRFMSVDPLTDKFPWYSTYQYAGNKPIAAKDLDGQEDLVATWQIPPEKLFSKDIFKNVAKYSSWGVALQFVNEDYQKGEMGISSILISVTNSQETKRISFQATANINQKIAFGEQLSFTGIAKGKVPFTDSRLAIFAGKPAEADFNSNPLGMNTKNFLGQPITYPSFIKAPYLSNPNLSAPTKTFMLMEGADFDRNSEITEPPTKYLSWDDNGFHLYNPAKGLDFKMTKYPLLNTGIKLVQKVGEPTEAKQEEKKEAAKEGPKQP